jgi:phosphoribosyl 1,2-cyclic phosphate phosphodiesterase
MISAGDRRVLIDVGPDFRQQMLTFGFKRLDAILLTHEHNDHISGLDDVRPVNFRQHSDIPVYGLQRVLDAVKRRFDYVFDPTYEYHGLPKLELKTLNPGEVVIAGIPIRVILVMHGPLDVLGFRIGDFCYITDAKTIPDDQMPFLEGLDTLVINALHRKTHFSHLNLSEAIALSERIGAGRTFLTHLSHDMGRHADVLKELPQRISLAYDGLSISIS